MQNLQETKIKVLEFIRIRGPVLPVQISKQIGSNIIFAGAIMSELVKTKQIKLSYAKIGGSPVYYVDGQEHKLQMLYDHLGEKEKKAYDLLRKEKVLMDSKLEPWQRIAFRELKDFAIPVKVNTGEIFWKWYLLSNEEIKPLVEGFLKIKPKEPEEIKKPTEIKRKPAEVKRKKIKPKKEKTVEKKPKKLEESVVINKITQYFNNKRGKVLKYKVIKKEKEIDLTVKVPSEIGDVKFFVKFLNKKKINDADLSLAHNKAQLRKMSLLVLTSGDLTKKAQKYQAENYLVFEKIPL